MRTLFTILALTIAIAASGGCAYHYGERGHGERCESGYGHAYRVDHYGGYRGYDHHDRHDGYRHHGW